MTIVENEGPLTATTAGRRCALFIEPPSRHFVGDKLFIVEDGRLNGDRMNAPYAYTRDLMARHGIPVHTADLMPPEGGSPDTTKIYVSMGLRDNYKRLAQRSDVVLSAYFAMECPIVEPEAFCVLPEVQQYFRHVFSWSDSPSLEHFVRRPLRLEQFFWPQSFDDVHQVWDNRDRRFLAMINSNKIPPVSWHELYTERVRAVEFFGQYAEVDLYGPGWDKAPNRVGTSWLPYTVRTWKRALETRWQQVRPEPGLAAARRAWRGTVTSKSETLSRYTFALCFENMILKGWITEKIFDCFFAGTVPIYWGAPEISDLIPPGCFIDMRQFGDYADLRRFLKALGPDEVARYRAEARDFVRSAAFQPWSKATFAERFLHLVWEAMDAPLASHRAATR